MENEAAQQPQSPAASPVMSRRAREANPFRAMVFGEQADKMIAQGISVIKLSLGEPDFGAPPAVRDAMREQYDGRALPYTAAMGLPELRQAIADFYHERHDLDIDPKRICVTAGGSAALLLATALTVDPGDDVIVADPSYPCNRELVRSFEGRVIDVPTSAATRFHLTADLCSQYWTSKTKAVMITSPSNPTGTTIDFTVLDEVCKLAASRGAWRIVDETYLDLADREPDGTEVKIRTGLRPRCHRMQQLLQVLRHDRLAPRLGYSARRPHRAGSGRRPGHQLLPVRPHAHPACGARLFYAGEFGRM